MKYLRAYISLILSFILQRNKYYNQFVLSKQVYFPMNINFPNKLYLLFKIAVLYKLVVTKYSWGDADPGPQDPCVVATVDKFTGTTEILWRKRDGMAIL